MKSFLDFVNESAPMNKAQYAEVRRKLGRPDPIESAAGRGYRIEAGR